MLNTQSFFLLHALHVILCHALLFAQDRDTSSSAFKALQIYNTHYALVEIKERGVYSYFQTGNIRSYFKDDNTLSSLTLLRSYAYFIPIL